MKSKSEHPEQQMAIMVVAGAFILFSVIKAINRSGPSAQETNQALSPQQSYSQSGQTIYQNPHLTWYERWFCRGFQRASFCSYRFIHPMSDTIKEVGIEMEEAPARHNGAVDYRGKLPVNRAFKSKFSFSDRSN